MILQNHLTELQGDLTSFDVDRKPFMPVRDMFGEDAYTVWLTNDPQTLTPSVVKALLLRIPLTIYVHERSDGNTYDVLRGGEVIETLRAVSKMDRTDQVALHRRIMETTINVVVFRCNMSRQDAEKCVALIPMG